MKTRFGLALFSSVALLACTEKAPTMDPVAAEPVTVQEPAPDFAGQMQQIAQDYFALRPETATYYGVPDEKAGAGISSRLARYSVEGEIARRPSRTASGVVLSIRTRSTATVHSKAVQRARHPAPAAV